MGKSQAADNVKAGAFVLAALILAFTVTLVLSGARDLFTPSRAYIVRFELPEGSSGLKPGSRVNVGGRECGKVRSIGFALDEQSRPVGIEVDIVILAELPVYSDARIFLESPLLGTQASLNFHTLGGEAPDAERLAEGAVIEGDVATPDVLARAGYGPEQARQLQSILSRVDTASERFVSLSAQIQDDILPFMQDAAEGVNSFVAEAQDRSGGWFDNIDAASSGAASLTEEARAGVEEARQAVAEIREVVDNNRAAVERTVANAEDASETLAAVLDRAEQETMEMIAGLLEDGRAGVNEARSAIEKADALLVEQTPEVRATMANTRLASEQLRLTMGEVRRAPWRLLYRPDKKELEFELLYDATRSYAAAVSDLRAASASLQALADSGAERTSAGRPVGDLLEEVQNAFQRYQDAERRFLDLLDENALEQ